MGDDVTELVVDADQQDWTLGDGVITTTHWKNNKFILHLCQHFHTFNNTIRNYKQRHLYVISELRLLIRGLEGFFGEVN